MDSEEGLIVRLISVYVVQMALALIFASGFFYFSRLYARPFLSRWAVSWVAFFFVGLGMVYSTLPAAFKWDSTWVSLLGSATYMIGGFMQSVFLLIGTYELIKETQLRKRTVSLLIIITLIVATGLTLLYAFDPSHFNERYFIRIGLRCLITGIVFIYCGSMAFLNLHFGTSGFGKKLLGIAFFMYGLELLVYFLVVWANIVGYNFSVVLSFFGVLDLFFITIMGLGMVMWLLEDERMKLKKMNADLDSFFYSTSHDLRAPISSILGLTHLASMETKDKTMIQYFSMIEARIKKLDEVIGDILNYSKSSKLEIKKEEIDFNQLLEEIRSDVKFSETATKIRPVYEASEKNIVKTDASQLRIILSNLISNAIKYHDLSRDDPYIKVTFSKQGPEVSISVSDNGKGIETEHLDKIFNMFYRASTDSEGSGLGLFIVKEAAAKINGEVTVQSEPGNGSTFTLTFRESG